MNPDTWGQVGTGNAFAVSLPHGRVRRNDYLASQGESILKSNKPGKIIFVCQGCGYHSLKWLGKCPECGEWDSLVEERQGPTILPGGATSIQQAQPVPLDSVEMDQGKRIKTGIQEFDRVLGGGLVPGSLILVGGDPGIGKSTLMLQILHRLAENKLKVLYISGEESLEQIKLRSDRLGIGSENLWVVSEVALESIRAMADEMVPNAMVIDSIQTVFTRELASAPGSVSQVREATLHLMHLAKQTGIPVFLVGHVTKDGAIAGPRLLEHIVDTVLYFEGEQNNIFRILRAVKNRFGSTNEIGVFEMRDSGLCEVMNPSAIFLSNRPSLVPGSVVTASIEGSRPILLELQALVGRASFGTPRRTVLGVDFNRVSLLVAVMEKKLGLQLMTQDIFVNVTGGVKVDEPAVDLGIVSAIASSFSDKPVREATVVLGEIGLTGEIRSINQVGPRVQEAQKMGFTRCLLPEQNLEHIKGIADIETVGVRTISELADLLF
ncbi:MAG: DNA repair protein RadA [Deltaproteobacteria bacterium]|nr:DNA repair protein RadA [Deltaproteobacteria bacterium]